MPLTSTPSTRPSGRRVARRVGLVAAIAGLGYAVVGTICFVLPHSDPVPEHADVAMVLGPPLPQRQAVALDLLRRGVVDAVQISVEPRGGLPDGGSETAKAVCASTPDVFCASPRPNTTQGEARMLRDAAAAQGWRSAVVVTQNAHLLRARTIVARCFTGRVSMEASGEGPTHGWPYEFAYQTAATIKAWAVTSTC